MSRGHPGFKGFLNLSLNAERYRFVGFSSLFLMLPLAGDIFFEITALSKAVANHRSNPG